MKKIYALLTACLIGIAAIAQTTLTIGHTDGISVDGTADADWTSATANSIESPGDIAATLNEAYFKMLWGDTALYVLVFVDDDDFCPFCPKSDGSGNWTDWQSDRPELFFNFNAQPDTSTTGAENGPANGKYQYAGGFQDGQTSYVGEADGWLARHYYWGYVADEDVYTIEYALPARSLLGADLDTNGTPGTLMTLADGSKFGFDISLMDRDATDGDLDSDGSLGDGDRKWMKWMAGTDSWTDMSDAAIITLTTGSSVNTQEVTTVQITPNPVVDYININAEFDAVTFYNALGQEVLSRTNLTDTRVDVAVLPKGLYYVTVLNKNKVVGLAKILK